MFVRIRHLVDRKRTNRTMVRMRALLRNNEFYLIPLALVIGGVSLLGGVMMMRTVKGPKWMLVELPLYLVLAYLAAVIAGPV